MKEKKEPIVWRGILFDSDEEVFFAMWLYELWELKYVQQWKKVKESIPLTKGRKIEYIKTTKLKTKIKEEHKEYTLLNPSEYTPDFEIVWTDKGMDKFLYRICYAPRTPLSPKEALFFTGEFNETLVEIKPSFDQNNMERLFKNNQKFIWDKYKIFVNLVEPIELFKKTFLPLAAAPHFRYARPPKGKKVGDYKFDWIPKSIHEFLNINT